jgi:hypothetical protein
MNPIAKKKLMGIIRDLGISSDLVKITDSPANDLYLHCGKPPKVKKLEDVIGKKLVIDGKSCIITYPVSFLIEKGEEYTARFIYTMEIIKNEYLVLDKWRYEEGKIC